MGDTHVISDVKTLKHQKSEYSLTVGKHSVTVSLYSGNKSKIYRSVISTCRVDGILCLLSCGNKTVSFLYQPESDTNKAKEK